MESQRFNVRRALLTTIVLKYDIRIKSGDIHVHFNPMGGSLAEKQVMGLALD